MDEVTKNVLEQIYGTSDERILRKRANRQSRQQTRRLRRLRYTFQKTKGKANR